MNHQKNHVALRLYPPSGGKKFSRLGVKLKSTTGGLLAFLKKERRRFLLSVLRRVVQRKSRLINALAVAIFVSANQAAANDGSMERYNGDVVIQDQSDIKKANVWCEKKRDAMARVARNATKESLDRALELCKWQPKPRFPDTFGPPDDFSKYEPANQDEARATETFTGRSEAHGQKKKHRKHKNY